MDSRREDIYPVEIPEREKRENGQEEITKEIEQGLTPPFLKAPLSV
jgi:hypothetical protein